MTFHRREKAEEYIASIPQPIDEMKWEEVALQSKRVDPGLCKVIQSLIHAYIFCSSVVLILIYTTFLAF